MSGTNPTPGKKHHRLPPVPHVAQAQVSPTNVALVQRLLAEVAHRKIESLNLYDALPAQESFHASKAPERLLRGSNRGGKTLPAAVEVARAVTGQDPYRKYPEQDGVVMAVGKDGKHVAQVMMRKLSRAGAFKIIRDHETGEWRAFKPFLPVDLIRFMENPKCVRLAPPLIPPRLIESIGWENKRENQPNVVKLVTGWEIRFFSSLGKPPQGSDVDLVWLDEEIVDPDWYPEMSSRLLDRRGRLIWSATPQSGTDQLFALHERAEQEKDQAAPRVTEHVILLAHNPHIEEAEKKLLADKLSEDEARVRIEGEFAMLGYRVYPEYRRLMHAIDYFEVPRHWTRYAVIDPGRQVCAVLFAAVPPPGEGDKVYLYDELYIRDCSAEVFAQQMAQKTAGQTIQSFICDQHGAAHTDAGSGLSVAEHYSTALRKHRVESVATGHNFVWGFDNVQAGVEAFRAWLRPAEDGLPKVRVMVERLKHFEAEIKTYRYKRVGGVVTDKPEDRGRVHLMACSRYLASYNPRYHKPPVGKSPGGAAFNAFKRKEKKRKEQSGAKNVVLGPASK
jgi:hypothetical protein